MTLETPRLRMFAGPNGSGKSTLKTVLPPELLGVYLNPDEIETNIRKFGELDLLQFGVDPGSLCEEVVQSFFRSSDFLKDAGLEVAARRVTYAQGRIGFDASVVNSYFASVTADFLRQRLMEQRSSFTLETVMSSPDKVKLLRKAQELGYRTYLYYIATADPLINVQRVKNRVKLGGHSVPESKIIKRYFRSLEQLIEAIHYTNRAYVFDNSGDRQDRTWLAEITGGRLMEIKAGQVPAWFVEYVLNKVATQNPRHRSISDEQE